MFYRFSVTLFVQPRPISEDAEPARTLRRQFFEQQQQQQQQQQGWFSK